MNVTITINDRPQVLPGPATVAAIVKEITSDPRARGIAVAVDGEVIRRGAWERTVLDGGQRVEILEASQGG